MTTVPASSALCFFNSHTNGGLLLCCPVPVSCSLDALRSHGGSHLGSPSIDSSTLSSRYADYGGCVRNSASRNCRGSFLREALAADGKFSGNRKLRGADSLAFNGFGGTWRDCSYDGHGIGSRDFTTACNSYGDEESFYIEASSMSSEHGNFQRFDRGFSAVEKSYGNAERSFREPLFESEGNTSSASVLREFPQVSSGNENHQKFLQGYPAVPLGRDVPLVSNRYPIGGHLSQVGSNASHERASPSLNATVSVFWDLDNKPPKSSPYHAALQLRKAASQFGSVIDMVAYANRHAFTHVPNWIREERRDRKQLDILEQRGQVQPEQLYVCNLCGRKCKTNLLLKKHFTQLHEREHNKRMSRLNSLKGRKRDKFKAAVQSKTARYKDAARPILVPKVGYGLESDLRRAGVYVKTVQYKPQAADIALKQQMSESMYKGVKCLCLVSDDTDFAQMLVDARALDLRTVVFGESKSLKRFADLWLPWDAIAQGLPVHAFQEATSAWRQHHHSSTEGQLHKNSSGRILEVSDVQHKIFAGSNPIRTSFSVFSEEERSQEHKENVDVYSSDDDDAGFAFDVEDELDSDFEDDFDDGLD